jgi:hypothetical protein
VTFIAHPSAFSALRLTRRARFGKSEQLSARRFPAF